ncbi:MAG: ABC transporter ATP-binding protein, partial [Candidatus Latescibacteria bacterium]|nr:ABC transporter ATP-binding protein [Candidatus Latescibacterota bacterium]
MGARNTILSVEGLKVHFDIIDGTSKVLDDVELSVREGEVVGLAGETGCGKSVTAKIILGSLPMPPGRIVDGKIFFLGDNLLELNREERYQVMSKKMSYIPQDPMTSLNPVFTVGEQMGDLIRWHGRRRITPLEFMGLQRKHDNSIAKAVELLDRVKIPAPKEIIRRYPVELSGGMRQRVLIATALIGHSSLLIADEPTTALDVTTQKGILELIEEKVKEEELSVLYITHNLGVARRLCDRIYVMYAGTIAETAKTEDLLDNPKHPYTSGLISSIPKLTGDEFKGIDGRIADYIDPPSGCRFHPRCPQVMEICEQEKPELVKVGEDHLVACHLFST